MEERKRRRSQAHAPAEKHTFQEHKEHRRRCARLCNKRSVEEQPIYKQTALFHISLPNTLLTTPVLIPTFFMKMKEINEAFNFY